MLDFDWSLVEGNSDTFVLRELGAWDIFQRYIQLTGATAAQCAVGLHGTSTDQSALAWRRKGKASWLLLSLVGRLQSC